MKINRLTRNRSEGFTRADLAVLLAILAVLLPLQLRIFGVNPGRSSRTAACMANQQRLALAWNLYSVDNLGILPNNYPGNDLSADLWVGGWLDPATNNQDNTNITQITKGLLWPYVQNASRYVCPADPSRTRAWGMAPRLPLVRSYSMNASLNGNVWTAGFHLFKNQSEIRKPQGTFVFMDERFDSINDSMFWVDMTGFPTNSDSTAIIDYPAFYHDNGAVLAFADEHVEHWIWSDPRTTPAPLIPSAALKHNVPSPNNPDMVRIQSVSTYRDE